MYKTQLKDEIETGCKLIFLDILIKINKKNPVKKS